MCVDYQYKHCLQLAIKHLVRKYCEGSELYFVSLLDDKLLPMLPVWLTTSLIS